MRRVPKSLERRLERLESRKGAGSVSVVFANDIDLKDGETLDDAIERLRDDTDGAGLMMVVEFVGTDTQP